MSPTKLPILIPVLVALGGGTIALAQSTPPPANKPAPEAGANSFTEAQAKDRIAKAGFTGVTRLKKDDQGIWRGSAKKNGKQVNVSLDFRGNVTTK
jgi:putative membrane protein